jgi:hypothetical protein
MSGRYYRFLMYDTPRRSLRVHKKHNAYQNKAASQQRPWPIGVGLCSWSASQHFSMSATNRGRGILWGVPAPYLWRR